jgi:hypothetical protein
MSALTRFIFGRHCASDRSLTDEAKAAGDCDRLQADKLIPRREMKWGLDWREA